MAKGNKEEARYSRIYYTSAQSLMVKSCCWRMRPYRSHPTESNIEIANSCYMPG